MAQPIRWDNVIVRGNSEAMQGIGSAASLFQNAFSGLQDTLRSREAIDAANVQNTKANNTTTYLDQVAKYQNADELRAAQQSGGALDQLRQSFGYQIDANAVRGAADTRAGNLMDQAAKKITYDHMLRDEKTAPLLDALHTASLNKDEAGFNAAMQAYTAAGGVDAAGALKYKIDRDRQVVVQGQQDSKFRDELLTSKAQRTHLSNADANDAARIGLERQRLTNDDKRLGIESERANWDHSDRLQKRLTDAIEKMGIDPKTTLGSPAGVQAVGDAIAKMPKETQDIARKAIGQMPSGTPLSAVNSALLGVTDSQFFSNWNLYDSKANIADRATQRAAEAATSKDTLQALDRANTAYSLRAANVKALSQQYDAAQLRESGIVPSDAGSSTSNAGGKVKIVPNPVDTTELRNQERLAANEVQKMRLDSAAASAGGYYGPNGWVEGNDSAAAQATVDSFKGKGFYDMSAADRAKLSEARKVLKEASTPAASTQPSAKQVAEQRRAAERIDLQAKIADMEAAKAKGTLLDPSYLESLKRRLRDSSK